jgi:glycosyltransferase involved in cell wall biosynthesis
MKTICFFNSTPFWGGGEKWHLENALGFRAKGHRVIIAAYPNGPLYQRARARGLETTGFPISNLTFLNPLERRRLRRFFESNRVDTVVINNPNDVKAAGLSARRAGVPQRVYARAIAVPVRDRRLNRYLFSRVLTHIVANSEMTKRTLLRNLGGVIPADKVKVIYYGIDLEAFDNADYRPLFERREGEILLGNVGRLTEQKGQKYLLEVARKLKAENISFRLLIAGAGELQEELARAARALGVSDEVEFPGFVADVKSFMTGIDIFLLSSLWEGFGYVIVEANAARKPVVAFDMNSNPEIIEENVTGFLVPPQDLNMFAQKTLELIRDPALRNSMGAAARRHVEEKFDFITRVNELEAYLWA